MNERKLRHPFNSEIDLETFKHMFNINGSITTSQNELVNVFKNFNPFEPLLSISKDLKFTDKIIFNNNIAFSLYDYNITIEKNTKLITKSIDPKELDNYKEDIQKSINKLDSNNNKKSSYSYYFINYYYLDPKETLEDKLKYIESMQELELPKKYIYDLVNDKEFYNGDLKPQDKLILNLGLNQTEYFNLFLKNYIEEYYTQEGFKYIKDLYKKLRKIEAYNPFTHSMLLNIHDELTLNDDLYLFNELVLNKESNNIIYTNSNIKSYHDLLEYNFRFFNVSLKIYNQDEKSFNNLLSKNKLTLDELKEYILIKYNSNNFDYLTLIHRTNIYRATQIIEATNRPLERILELIDNNIVFKEYQEDLLLYNELTTAKDDSKEHLYYLYLQLLILNKNFIKDNINNINVKLKKINDLSTTEYFINEESKLLFTYHRRTEILKNELEAREQSKIKEQVNNINHALFYNPISCDKLNSKDKKTNSKLLNDKELIKNEIENIKTSLKNIDEDSLEHDNLIARKKDLESNLKTTNEELLKNKIIDIIYTNEKTHEKEIATCKLDIEQYNSNGTKAIELAITDSNLILKHKTTNISFALSNDYITLQNKKEITKTFSFKDFSPYISQKFYLFLHILHTIMWNNPTRYIVINLDEDFLKSLDYSLKNKDKAIQFIRIATTIIYNMGISEAKLMQKKKSKNNELKSVLATRILDSYKIENNKLSLVINEIYFNYMYSYNQKINNYQLNGSQFYRTKELGLNPTDTFIHDYLEDMVSIKSPRKLSVYSIIKILPGVANTFRNYQNRDEARKVSNSINNSINNINKSNSNILISEFNPSRLKCIANKEQATSYTFTIQHKEETPKERHIRESKELKENKE